MLAGISGIDASGKGYLSSRLDAELKRQGMRTALIGVDGWLNLPHVRFSDTDPARHFYDHALRQDEMFDRLVLPLKQNRSVKVTANFAEETATVFRPVEYGFRDIDIILLEGIFLFKPQFARHFDLRIWVECTFETALTRAVERSQEGLTKDLTIEAYSRIYFPAQLIHIEYDRPIESADILLNNNLTK